MYALIVFPFLSTLGDSFRGRAVLQLELLALRHQLAVSARTPPGRNLRMADRLLWVICSRILPNWRDVLVIVKPETVVGWHRKVLKSVRGSQLCCITVMLSMARKSESFLHKLAVPVQYY